MHAGLQHHVHQLLHLQQGENHPIATSIASPAQPNVPWGFSFQPTDDIVLMAQTLEKIFLQKVAQMPPEEQEIVVPVARNSHKKGASRAAGTAHRDGCCGRSWFRGS